MAYSDYGGYAFRNGQRVEDRSDYTITPDGGYGTPGAWPGIAQVLNPSADKTIRYPYHHVVLGDGPIFVGLHKQSATLVYRGIEELDLPSIAQGVPEEAIKEWTNDGKTEKYIDDGYFRDNDEPLKLLVDGVQIEIRYTFGDNYYQFVRVEQPDGVVWCGWSGYGVGAGLEDEGYGYDSEDCNAEMLRFWPDSIAKTETTYAA